MAMTAELKKLKDDNLHLAKSFGKKGKSTSNKVKSDDKGGGKKKTKKSKQQSNNEKFAWKKVAPLDGEAHTKMVNDLKYFWCPYHNAWTCHNPDGKETDPCHKRQELEAKQGNSGNCHGNQMASALATILTDIQEKEKKE